jgi:hypothetical protein
MKSNWQKLKKVPKEMKVNVKSLKNLNIFLDENGRY